MEPIYLICYGSAEENVNISLKTKIVGANNAKIPQGQRIYLIVKRDGQWMVVARGTIDSDIANNPFHKPNKFRTYLVKDLVECTPFSISQICKEVLGPQYGLIMRTPRPITNTNFVEYLAENFR